MEDPRKDHPHGRNCRIKDMRIMPSIDTAPPIATPVLEVTHGGNGILRKTIDEGVAYATIAQSHEERADYSRRSAETISQHAQPIEPSPAGEWIGYIRFIGFVLLLEQFAQLGWFRWLRQVSTQQSSPPKGALS